MHFFPEYQPLFERVDADTWLLTPNRRLSRFLQDQYDLWCDSRATVWPALQALAWGDWLQDLWGQMQLLGLPEADVQVLNAAQQRLLWSQAMASTRPELLAEDALVEAAASAWRYLRQWRKSLAEVPAEMQEVALFKQWVVAYQDLAQQYGFVDSVEQSLRVHAALLGGDLPVPKQLVLVGFDEIPPVDEHLCAGLRERGTQLQRFDVCLAAQATRVQLADRQTELQRAARWAAALVQQSAQASQSRPASSIDPAPLVGPAPLIGIVVPDLAQLRPTVERIFTRVFEPQALQPDSPRHAPGFNLSAAQPLAQTPLLAAALLALKLNDNALPRDTLSRLLSSPFLGDAEELSGRLALDQRMRLDHIKVPVSTLRAAAQPICPLWHQRLLAFERLLPSRQRNPRRFGEWAQLFEQQLQALGWPGPRALDTLEYQQHSHWPGLLADLAALDAVSGPVGWQRALAELGRLAYVPFHPQTHNSPVQVLGLLEAAGQSFDYLWITGLDDRVWPESIQPNPLLPPALQRQWQMPRASAEREQALAQRLTERLRNSAYTVVFSTPTLDGDQILRPSPLLEALPEAAAQDLPELDRPWPLWTDTAELVSVDDHQAPPLTSLEPVRGGSQMLKDQAACPFRAFAIHRLHAQAAAERQIGISPQVRGELLHLALERLWRQLQTQAALLALDEAPLQALVQDTLARAWLDLPGQSDVGARVRDLELQRSAQLLVAWLALERQRPPFRVVFQESRAQVQVGQLPIHIRYDRVDELQADGGLVVLDYKSGKADINKWASDRPEEPQVPLYAVAQHQAVRGAVLAQMHISEVAAKGLAADETVWPGLAVPGALARLDLPADWPDVLAHWRRTLDRLADEFAAGHAWVDPKQPSSTCRFCDLHSLCRIGAELGDAAEDAP